MMCVVIATYKYLILLCVLSLKINVLNGWGVKVLSRDCDGCERQLFECKRRFSHVCLGEKVFCPDGTANLVDSK